MLNTRRQCVGVYCELPSSITGAEKKEDNFTRAPCNRQTGDDTKYEAIDMMIISHDSRPASVVDCDCLRSGYFAVVFAGFFSPLSPDSRLSTRTEARG